MTQCQLKRRVQVVIATVTQGASPFHTAEFEHPISSAREDEQVTPLVNGCDTIALHFFDSDTICVAAHLVVCGLVNYEALFFSVGHDRAYSYNYAIAMG